MDPIKALRQTIVPEARGPVDVDRRASASPSLALGNAVPHTRNVGGLTVRFFMLDVDALDDATAELA